HLTLSAGLGADLGETDRDISGGSGRVRRCTGAPARCPSDLATEEGLAFEPELGGFPRDKLRDLAIICGSRARRAFRHQTRGGFSLGGSGVRYEFVSTFRPSVVRTDRLHPRPATASLVHRRVDRPRFGRGSRPVAVAADDLPVA